MPTDLTGTPTSLGIGTYNTSVDAPSGLGFNEAMDQIDALIAARMKVVGTPVDGQVPVWNATNGDWEPGSITAGPGTPVTALPASPTDGEQAILTDNTATPTYAWLMQYSSAASKWLFIGGSPANSSVAASESTTSTTFIDLGTVGPEFTIPAAGTYDFNVSSGHIQNSGSDDARIGLMKNGVNVVEIASANAAANVSNVATMGGLYRTTAAAGDVFKLEYRTRSGGTHTFFQREMNVTPVAVT